MKVDPIVRLDDAPIRQMLEPVAEFIALLVAENSDESDVVAKIEAASEVVFCGLPCPNSQKAPTVQLSLIFQANLRIARRCPGFTAD